MKVNRDPFRLYLIRSRVIVPLLVILLNVIFPIQKDGKKTVKLQQGCFNCGKSGHSTRDCEVLKDDTVIRNNSRLHREFSGGSSGNQRWGDRYYREDALVKDVKDLVNAIGSSDR